MNETIRSIVRAELGATPSRVTRIEDGLQHETYGIACGGEEYVLQFSGSEPVHRDSLSRCLACYRALADSAVPVPAVVTETVREYDGGEYVLVERLPGETAEGEISRRRVRAAGRCLARLHDTRRFETTGPIAAGGEGDAETETDAEVEPRAGPEGESGPTRLTVGAFPDGPLDRRIRRICSNSADLLRAHGLERAGAGVESLFEGDGEFPPPASAYTPVLCHDDFSADNVLFSDGEVVGVLDFDRAYAGHRQRDLARSANAFWMQDPYADWAIRETFYEGYREVGSPGADFEGIEPRYRVETLARTVAGMAKLRGLSDFERDVYDRKLVAAVERAEGE